MYRDNGFVVGFDDIYIIDEPERIPYYEHCAPANKPNPVCCGPNCPFCKKNKSFPKDAGDGES